MKLSCRMCLPCNAALAAEGSAVLTQTLQLRQQALGYRWVQALRNLCTFSPVRLADAVKYTSTIDSVLPTPSDHAHNRTEQACSVK
jgi:hypothetical protein